MREVRHAKGCVDGPHCMVSFLARSINESVNQL
jgi:hypothetical protein